MCGESGIITVVALTLILLYVDDRMAFDNKGKELPSGITQRKDGRYQATYSWSGKR